jgi:hypothetical protein
MAMRVINGKRFVIQQIPKKHTTPLHSAGESNPKQSPESSVIQTTETHIVRKKVEPKNRIVVVRTTSTTKDESGEVMESNENEASKSVELPAALTNGVNISFFNLKLKIFFSVHLFILFDDLFHHLKHHDPHNYLQPMITTK